MAASCRSRTSLLQSSSKSESWRAVPWRGAPISQHRRQATQSRSSARPLYLPSRSMTLIYTSKLWKCSPKSRSTQCARHLSSFVRSQPPRRPRQSPPLSKRSNRGSAAASSATRPWTTERNAEHSDFVRFQKNRAVLHNILLIMISITIISITIIVITIIIVSG